MRAGDEPLN